MCNMFCHCILLFYFLFLKTKYNLVKLLGLSLSSLLFFQPLLTKECYMNLQCYGLNVFCILHFLIIWHNFCLYVVSEAFFLKLRRLEVSLDSIVFFFEQPFAAEQHSQLLISFLKYTSSNEIYSKTEATLFLITLKYTFLLT